MGELQALSQQAETLCCASSFPYLDPQYLAMHIAAPAAAWKLHATPVAQALSHYCRNTQAGRERLSRDGQGPKELLEALAIP